MWGIILPWQISCIQCPSTTMLVVIISTLTHQGTSLYNHGPPYTRYVMMGAMAKKRTRYVATLMLLDQCINCWSRNPAGWKAVLPISSQPKCFARSIADDTAISNQIFIRHSSCSIAFLSPWLDLYTMSSFDKQVRHFLEEGGWDIIIIIIMHRSIHNQSSSS